MTHTYFCKKCNHKWEHFVVSLNEEVFCEKCNSSKWDRIGIPRVSMNPITDQFLRDEKVID
tara:strand:- start:516 stop:698 length:183 start_codon:yes stop_codon:yes gene_type:complete